MDKGVIFIVALLLSCLPTNRLSAQNNASDADGYVLVWEDNFDGTALDRSKWDIEVNKDGGGNNELQYYREENVSVDVEPESNENCLIITAKKEYFDGKNFTSGRVRTYGKMSFKYGKVEGRIKLPKTANGLWPAFWMLGADYYQVGWPKCGETDILEMGNINGIKNGTQDRYFSGWFHWGEKWTPNGYPNWGMDKTTDYSLQDDFHLYTVIWDSESIKMYLDLDKYPDSEPYVEMNTAPSVVPGETGHYFNKPFNILINMAIGGDFTGIHSIDKITALNADNNYEAKMYVDYVRVYQKGDEGEELIISTTELDSPKEFSRGNVNQRFLLCPNPTTGDIHIDGAEIPLKIYIFDLNGRQVMEFEGTNKINISSLQSGNYLLRIETQNGYAEIHQIAKK